LTKKETKKQGDSMQNILKGSDFPQPNRRLEQSFCLDLFSFKTLLHAMCDFLKALNFSLYGLVA